MRVSTLLASLATLALFDVALAGRHTGSSWTRRHSGHHGYSTNEDGSSGYGNVPGATKDVQKVSGREFELSKRYDNSRFSFYDAGLGACGKVNSGSDFIVALNSAQFDSGDYCFKKISITINGKTTEATVTDRCPGCPYGGLDFSRGLFNFFASESVGIIHGSWGFGGAPPPPPPPPPPKPAVVVSVEIIKPKPSPPPPPPPPPPPKPSPPPEPEPTTVVSSSIISIDLKPTSTSTIASSTSVSTSSSAAPTTSQIKEEKHKGCIENLDLALAHLGAMVVSGSHQNGDNQVYVSSSASAASVSTAPAASASKSASASASPASSASA